MDPLTRMWRIRRTCFQMLNSRGYLVPQSDLNMTKEEFRNQYGESPRKDDLVVLVPRQDDPTEQVSWLQMRAALPSRGAPSHGARRDGH